MVRLPKSGRMLDGVDTSEAPIFSVSELAKVFFDRSPHWVRLKEREGVFQFNGEYVGGYRTEGKTGARRYTLSNVEEMTYALAAADGITGTQHLHALMVVKAIADVYELFVPESIEEEPTGEPTGKPTEVKE